MTERGGLRRPGLPLRTGAPVGEGWDLAVPGGKSTYMLCDAIAGAGPILRSAFLLVSHDPKARAVQRLLKPDPSAANAFRRAAVCCNAWSDTMRRGIHVWG